MICSGLKRLSRTFAILLIMADPVYILSSSFLFFFLRWLKPNLNLQERTVSDLFPPTLGIGPAGGSKHFTLVEIFEEN